LTLGPQFYDCDRFPAPVFCLKGLFGDQGMSFEKFTESFSERAGAVAVNDANSGNVCKGGVVEKFVDALGRFLDGRPDEIDFFRSLAFASLTMPASFTATLSRPTS
jgi:hypothetical protein